MYKNNRGTFLPGHYHITGYGGKFVLRINKRARYTCDMKGTYHKHDDTHAGLRIYYDEEQDDHYVEIRVKKGATMRCYWHQLATR